MDNGQWTLDKTHKLLETNQMITKFFVYQKLNAFYTEFVEVFFNRVSRKTYLHLLRESPQILFQLILKSSFSLEKLPLSLPCMKPQRTFIV